MIDTRAIVGGFATIEDPYALAVAINLDGRDGTPFASLGQLRPTRVFAISLWRAVRIGVLGKTGFAGNADRGSDADAEHEFHLEHFTLPKLPEPYAVMTDAQELLIKPASPFAAGTTSP